MAGEQREKGLVNDQGEKGPHCWLGWGHEEGQGLGDSHSQFSNIPIAPALAVTCHESVSSCILGQG